MVRVVAPDPIDVMDVVGLDLMDMMDGIVLVFKCIKSATHM